MNVFCRVLSIEQSKRDGSAHLTRILTGGEGFPLEKEQNLWSCVCISWWKSGMKKLLIMFDDEDRSLGGHKSNSESIHHGFIIAKEYENILRRALSQPEYIQKIDERSVLYSSVRYGEQPLQNSVCILWRSLWKIWLKSYGWLIHFYNILGLHLIHTPLKRKERRRPILYTSSLLLCVLVFSVGDLSLAMGARNQVGIGLSYRPASLYVAWLLTSRLGSIIFGIDSSPHSGT